MPALPTNIDTRKKQTDFLNGHEIPINRFSIYLYIPH